MYAYMETTILLYLETKKATKEIYGDKKSPK
jgi:hypothetical protein